jgi:DNA-binding winged helix-turn-helix (wHTH) protein
MLPDREVYAFGGFELDVEERRLVRSGAPVALAPKAFDLLVALVR